VTSGRTPDAGAGQVSDASRSTAPADAAWVLAALIAVAAVANLGLAVANVALPDIGLHFDASQTALNLCKLYSGDRSAPAGFLPILARLNDLTGLRHTLHPCKLDPLMVSDDSM
jgi:hypothetical protein